jgi:hypothetical protein
MSVQTMDLVSGSAHATGQRSTTVDGPAVGPISTRRTARVELPEWDLGGRAAAIAEGVAVEVPRLLCDAFALPWSVAVTRSVWADAVAWPERAAQQVAAALIPAPAPGESARLAQVLHAAAQAIRSAATGGAAVSFVVWRVSPAEPVSRPSRVSLVLVLQPGDSGETVATIAAAPIQLAGWFEFSSVLGGRWPAAAFTTEPAMGAGLAPLVTPETLDAVLSAGWDDDDCPVTGVTQLIDGAVRVLIGHQVITLTPDVDGRYEVSPLGWALRCVPAETGVASSGQTR